MIGIQNANQAPLNAQHIEWIASTPLDDYYVEFESFAAMTVQQETRVEIIVQNITQTGAPKS